MAAAQVSDILRFLAQDAKISLAMAMSKVPELQKANLVRYYNPPLFNNQLRSNKVSA